MEVQRGSLHPSYTMETNSGNSLTPILTEDWYCPRHALHYEEAYNNCTKYYDHALTHAQFSVPMQDREEFWIEKSRHVGSMCYCTASARTTFCFEMATKWRNKWLEESAKNEARSKLSRDLGPREFTLTYSPSWFDAEEAKRTMTQAIERLTRYYKHEIIEFHAIGEYTSAGNPHIHAFYLLDGGRKITDKNFKRAYPRWNPKKKLGRGFEGGHHETVDRISDFAGYTEKHLEEAWLNIHISNGPPEIVNPSPTPHSSQEDDA